MGSVPLGRGPIDAPQGPARVKRFIEKSEKRKIASHPGEKGKRILLSLPKWEISKLFGQIPAFRPFKGQDTKEDHWNPKTKERTERITRQDKYQGGRSVDWNGNVVRKSATKCSSPWGRTWGANRTHSPRHGRKNV